MYVDACSILLCALHLHASGMTFTGGCLFGLLEPTPFKLKTEMDSGSVVSYVCVQLHTFLKTIHDCRTIGR